MLINMVVPYSLELNKLMKMLVLYSLELNRLVEIVVPCSVELNKSLRKRHGAPGCSRRLQEAAGSVRRKTP